VADGRERVRLTFLDFTLYLPEYDRDGDGENSSAIKRYMNPGKYANAPLT
jgi:hypothetical protein